MHKKTFKQNTIRSLENLSKSRNYRSNENESTDFQLPNLQKKKTWKNLDDSKSNWEQIGGLTSTSYSLDIESIATRQVLQQWKAVDSTLYEDGEQVTQAATLEECLQWRKQIPHLRIIGKAPLLSHQIKSNNLNTNCNKIQSIYDNLQNDETFLDHSLQLKEKNNSFKDKLQKVSQDEIISLLYEYVISELFPNKEKEIGLLCNNFNDVLQGHIAPIQSNKKFVKSTNSNWSEEKISPENRFLNSKHRTLEDTILIRKETPWSNIQKIQKKYDYSIHNDELKNELDIMEDKLPGPHTSRNKLGTVFNKKIVVSSVPYVLSTKESFSTVKTTPIKFIAQSSNVSTFQGKTSILAKISNYQSAWHTSISSAVWPKNMRLAPLDTSKLPNNKNRSLTSSSVTLVRNSRPLSPIFRSIHSTSAQTAHNNTESLEIQGRSAISGQSFKSGIPDTARNRNTESSKNKRKKRHLKS